MSNQAIKSVYEKSMQQLRVWIEQKENPEGKANMQANLKATERFLAAHESGKYVGSGSVHADGICAQFTKYFVTEAEAEAEATRFPKMAKVKVGTLRGDGGVAHFVEIRATLSSGKVTGAANETGKKRLARFLSVIGEYVWNDDYIRNVLTKDAFKAAMGI